MDRKPLVTEITELDEEPDFPLLTKKPPAPRPTPTPAPTPAPQQPGSGPPPEAATTSSHFSFASSTLPALKHAVQYVGRPVESVSVTVDVPSSSFQAGGAGRGAGASCGAGPGVEVCGYEVFVSAPGCQALTLRLPFAVTARGATVAWEVGSGGSSGGSGGGGSSLKLQLPCLALPEYVRAMEEERPLGFGQLELVNDSFLELEP